MAALLTKMSIGPSSLVAVSMIRFRSAWTERSATIGKALPPFSMMPSTTVATLPAKGWSPSWPVRAVTATAPPPPPGAGRGAPGARAPPPASRSATAAPMPRLAPVTTATFPDSSPTACLPARSHGRRASTAAPALLSLTPPHCAQGRTGGVGSVTVVTLELTVVDAFTDRPFSGNPAAVAVLDEFPAEELMQAVAAELHLSETAFAVSRGGDRYDLRGDRE